MILFVLIWVMRKGQFVIYKNGGLPSFFFVMKFSDLLLKLEINSKLVKVKI